MYIELWRVCIISLVYKCKHQNIVLDTGFRYSFVSTISVGIIVTEMYDYDYDYVAPFWNPSSQVSRIFNF